ncbi:MAG: ABC transporter substrate-binding protein [Anaerolineales bacterium]
MFRNKKLALAFGLLMITSFLLAACQPAAAPTAEVITKVETVVVTKEIEGQTVEVVITATPLPPEPTEIPPERTLVICMGQEPETLYRVGGSMLAASSVLEAVYDGPTDGRSFDYQAVLIEKMPSLADGDAVIQAVEVNPGDPIVSEGDPTTLEDGVVYRPSGCMSDDCAETYAEGGGAVTVDQMVVTFKLLPGLMWSDGTPLTSADSIYAFNLQADPDTPASKYGIDRTESYEALDDVTLQWTGLPGYIDSTYFLNLYAPAPEHIWGQYTAAELLEAEEARSTPVGWGPYIIEEWTVGDNIRMTKNPNYFRADEGLPKFENLVYRMVGENSNANIAKILSGECDIVDQTSHLDDQSELLLELQAAGQVNATFVTGTVWEHADLGIHPVSYDDGWQAGDRPDFFGDVRTRRALAMCMDRQAVVDTVMFGQSVVLDTYLPPQHPLFNADVTHYEFDTAAGSALLEEAGWTLDGAGEDGVRLYAGDNPQIPAGTRLEFNYWTTNATQRQQATQVLAQTMAECGIQANLEYWSPGEYFADGPDGPLFGRRFDIGQFAWLTGVEPPCDLFYTAALPGDADLTVGDVPWLKEAMGEGADLEAAAFPFGWGGWSDTGYANPEFDAVCNAALQSLPGQASYDENHLAAQVIFADDLPVIPLYLRLKLAATRPDMCNFVMDPTANSEMWNIEEFDYGEGC